MTLMTCPKTVPAYTVPNTHFAVVVSVMNVKALPAMNAERDIQFVTGKLLHNYNLLLHIYQQHS